MTKPTRDAGFTLFEALAALAIFAAVSAAAQLAMRGAFKSSRETQSHLEAISVARSKLAEAGVTSPLAEGRTDGVAGRYAWSMSMRRRGGGPDRIASSDRAIDAYWVDVRVEWRASSMSAVRQVELTGLKLAGAR